MYTNPIQKRGDFADPFALRYQGRYYLYCTNPGVKCWSSADLLQWRCEGTVVPEEEFPGLVPFAPEVTYEGGFFYMYTSPHGLGHYVLRSQSPLGPFRKITPNVGHSIDFSVFLDEDGRRYAYWASDEGVLGCEMPTPCDFGAPVLVGAYLDGWTEGPFVVKRDGVYHLTYTGNHYLSKGYRVCEAMADQPLGPYRENPRNPLLVRAEGDVVGLGHSATVLGPDLTSRYLLYHNLNPDRTRDLNIERIVIRRDGSYTLGSAFHAMPAPALPDYAGDAPDGARWRIETADGYLARLNDALPERGAAEINLRADGAWSVALEGAGEALGVYVDGAEAVARIGGREAGRVPLGASYAPGAWHCVRLEWSDALTVWLDHRLAASLPAPRKGSRLACRADQAPRIGYHAYAAAKGEPPYPDEGWLPGLRKWRQLARENGRYALWVKPDSQAACAASVDGAPAPVCEKRGDPIARLTLPLRAGEQELALSNASALAVCPAPQNAPGAYRLQNVGPDDKRCVGEAWDDVALDVTLTPTQRREGWEAGALIRASQPADGGEGDDPALGRDFFLGYRVCVSRGRLSIWKHRYNARLLAEAPMSDADEYRLRVTCALGRIRVSADGRTLLEADDELPIPFGRVGVQARNCVISKAELTCQAAERMD